MGAGGTDVKSPSDIFSCIVTRNFVPGWFHQLCQVGEVDMAPFSPKFRQDLRKLERLVGRTQARALARKAEAQAQQAARSVARGTGAQRAAAQRAAASHEPQVFDRLVRRGKAGWVNVPGKPVAVLVEKGTGCVLEDSRGALVLKRRVMLPSKPAISESVFLQHLKDPDVENFVPHMYLDSEGNVTVGIGTLLSDAATAETLPFVKRGTNVAATSQEIKRDFNSVKNSVLTNTRAPGFRHLTNLDLSEAESEFKALTDMKDFIRIIRSSDNFPEFDSYPVAAKMGLLDMVYTSGAKGIREDFPVFTSAVRRRNWKLAAQESHRLQPSAKRNQTVGEVLNLLGNLEEVHPFEV
jgi:GH24 family phage-related lysozyme (muramidase)